MTNKELLEFVIESGRVLPSQEEGKFARASLEVEIEFEAKERGMDEAEAVAFALAHADHD